MMIAEHFLTNNPCYKKQQYITVRGLMLHSVGCNCSKASRFLNSFNLSTAGAMVNAFIDANTGIVYQTAPWDMLCWHSSGGANGKAYMTHAGIEMCESEYIQYTGGASFKVLDYEKAKAHVMTSYNSAVELFAYLCEKYNLDPLARGVVISHREGHTIYKNASNHGDPEHLWSQMGLPITMDIFRKAVAEKVEDNMTGEQIYQKLNEYFGEQVIPEWARKEYLEAIQMGITDGSNPMQLTPRYQTAIMIKRAVKEANNEK